MKLLVFTDSLFLEIIILQLKLVILFIFWQYGDECYDLSEDGPSRRSEERIEIHARERWRQYIDTVGSGLDQPCDGESIMF